MLHKIEKLSEYRRRMRLIFATISNKRMSIIFSKSKSQELIKRIMQEVTIDILQFKLNLAADSCSVQPILYK